MIVKEKRKNCIFDTISEETNTCMFSLANSNSKNLSKVIEIDFEKTFKGF